MPSAISLWIEPRASIVRCVGVTVKVDRQEVRISEGERCQRSYRNQHNARDSHGSAAEAQCGPRQPTGNNTRPPAPTSPHPEAERGERAKAKRRDVLSGSEKRQRIEDVREWRDDVIREGRPQSLPCRRPVFVDIDQRR